MVVRKIGRLGNHLYRVLAISNIAENNNYKCYYDDLYEINKLGITPPSGELENDSGLMLTVNNYTKYINQQIPTGRPSLATRDENCFLQTTNISNHVVNYLNLKYKNTIIEHNKYKHRYNNNTDLLVHVRLGDTANFAPPVEYFINTIKTFNYSKLYIATDGPRHNYIKVLTKQYPHAELLELEPVETLMFGSTCKYKILSNGTFSAFLGYLGFYTEKTIYPVDLDTSRISPCFPAGERWAYNLSIFQQKGWAAHTI